MRPTLLALTTFPIAAVAGGIGSDLSRSAADAFDRRRHALLPSRAGAWSSGCAQRAAATSPAPRGARRSPQGPRGPAPRLRARREPRHAVIEEPAANPRHRLGRQPQPMRNFHRPDPVRTGRREGRIPLFEALIRFGFVFYKARRSRAQSM